VSLGQQADRLGRKRDGQAGHQAQHQLLPWRSHELVQPQAEGTDQNANRDGGAAAWRDGQLSLAQAKPP